MPGIAIDDPQLPGIHGGVEAELLACVIIDTSNLGYGKMLWLSRRLGNRAGARTGSRPCLAGDLNGCFLVELKSVEKLAPVHAEQLPTYLKLTGFSLGLLINFGEALLKDGIRRIAN